MPGSTCQADSEIYEFLFLPGFTLRDEVTEISGRGVGLDVVRESVERLQGTVEVDSRVGVGTTFTLTLPVTVATTQCLLVRAAGQTFGLPLAGVGRTGWPFSLYFV